MFCVIYRWRLHASEEQNFKEGWSALVKRNKKIYGALGSRLHKSDNDIWVSYSQWISRDHWLASIRFQDEHHEARIKMLNAVIQQFEPIELIPSIDHLTPVDDGF